MCLKPELKITWATYDAAKYACTHWHYSKCLPACDLIKIAVYEDNIFKGVVIFSRGAAKDLLKPYGLTQIQGCELTRIALTNHKTEVSRIVSIALKFLKKHCPGLRLVISFADPTKNHHGGIYQAGNWIYTGMSPDTRKYFQNGKWKHCRTAGNNQSVKGLLSKVTPGKHRYLMPLDDEMKKQIEPLRNPYPKRMTKANSGDQPESGGAIPTHPLQYSQKK